MEVNLVSAEFALKESLRKENSPLENLGKVHYTVKWQTIYFITFGLILQKASSGQKILGKNQRRHVFFKMTGSAISGMAVTMSAADTRFTSLANIAKENHYGAIVPTRPLGGNHIRNKRRHFCQSCIETGGGGPSMFADW